MAQAGGSVGWGHPLGIPLAVTALQSWGQTGRELEPMGPGGWMAPGSLSLIDQDGISWWDRTETVRRVARRTPSEQNLVGCGEPRRMQDGLWDQAAL